MIKWRFFLKLAISAIQRGGQRSIAAILTVAFGVMSLICMTSLSESIHRVIMADGRSALGGDIQLYPSSRAIDSARLSEMETLQNQGLISAFTSVTVSFNIAAYRLDGSEILVYGASYGIDPESYPLISGFVLSESSRSPFSLLQSPGDIVITEDIASKHELALGETLRLVQLNGLGGPLEVRISGILRDTPDHSGSHIYYSHETAKRLEGYELSNTYVLALSSNTDALVSALEPNQWSWALPEDESINRLFAQSVFDFMLKGSGILGLMVGGISVANTMQVLLSRRREEIAILKTLGYSQADMLGLFTLEILLMSSIGSLVGGVLAYGLSASLIKIFANTGTMLLAWNFDALRFLEGSLIGILISLIFAFYAILKASEERPSLIFRQQMPSHSVKDWLKAILVYGLLSIPFAFVTTAIFADVLMGIAIIVIALAGFLILGTILSLLIWLGLLLMPSFQSQMLRLARNNLRKRRSSLLFAMIALFLGIYTLGFAWTIIDVSWDVMQSRQIESQGYNVIFYGQLRDKANFDAASQDIATEIRYIAPLARTEFPVDFDTQIRHLEAREATWDIQLNGGEDSADGAWVWDGFNIAVGTMLNVTNLEGEVYPLEVVGTYSILESQSILISQSAGLIVSLETLLEIAGDKVRLEWYAETSMENVQQILRVLPEISAATSEGIISSIGANLKNLFVFAVSMSGLALLAAVMLIANAVGLSMLERRYEIGVMKAVGYTQNQVLLILAYEYSLIALICSLIAIVAIQVTIILIGMLNGALTYLLLKPQTALLILILGVALSLFTAILSSYQPTKIKPSVILKSE
jgi:putative ABC transport system permease protein